MKRRTMLHILGSGVALPLQAFAKKMPKRKVNKGSLKKLLVIFQRGGNDGLNTLVPVSSAQYGLYRDLRPDLFIQNNELLSIPGSSFFGMHPGMSALSPIMNAGHLSWVHAVGYPSPNRSHFESQSYYETGQPGNAQTNGWLNRFLEQSSGAGLIRGIAIASSIPQMMTGDVAVPVSANFGNYEVRVDRQLQGMAETNYRNMLQQVFAAEPTSANGAIYNVGGRVFDMVADFADRNINSYTPENDAAYPSTPFGEKVMHAAQMLKDEPSNLGIEVVTVDQVGFDTHAGQVDPNNTSRTNLGHGLLLKELADSMAAFYTDMGLTRMQDTLVLVVSEFGRRAAQNDSNGTDHGTGALAMIMGTNVSGIAHNGDGDWPGLAAADLYEGDLDWVTDFRDIYWEILSQHMGVADVDLASILPGHTYNSVGIL